MSLKDRCGEKIHVRSVEVSTYECKGEGIIVEGVLKDERLKPYYLTVGRGASSGNASSHGYPYADR